MNTTENNKLIAEFMDWKQCDPNDNTIYANPTNGALHSSDSDMRFHTSWDWLIPVIQKVNEVSGYDDYNTDRLHIQRVLDDCINENAVGIDEVHKAVVEFINQYNN